LGGTKKLRRFKKKRKKCETQEGKFAKEYAGEKKKGVILATLWGGDLAKFIQTGKGGLEGVRSKRGSN